MAMTFKTNLRPDTDASRELGTSTAGWKITKLNAPTSSGGSTYGAGSAGQALVSNGTTVYWGDVTPPFSAATPSDLGTATAGTSTAVAHADHVHNMPSAADVGALPDDTFIPSKTSDLTNDAKFTSGITILTHGTSTWQDFIDAYNSNNIVYCKYKNGNAYRLAFLAYVNSTTNPTQAEFQYYKSNQTHSYTTQGDLVYCYKMNSSGTTWPTPEERQAYTKIAAGTGITTAYASNTLTISAAEVSTATTSTTGIVLLSNSAASTITGTGTATTGTSTSVARADHIHDISLETLTFGNSSTSKSYNGTSAITIDAQDLNLAASMRFIGLTDTDVSTNTSATSIHKILDDTTVTAQNGDVVIYNQEEYLFDGTTWSALGLATSYAIKNHIHGYINANGTISSATSSISGAKILISDNTNTIIGSTITFGSSGNTTYLQNNGSWGGLATTASTGLISSTAYTSFNNAANVSLTAGCGIAIDVTSAFGTTSGARTITNAGVRSIDTSGTTLWVDTNGSSTGITVPYATTASTATYDSSGNTIASTYVLKSGDTMTGSLTIESNNGQRFVAKDTTSTITIDLRVGTQHQNHGLYSNGYAPTGTTFTSSGKWIIYRDSEGDARTQLKLYGAVWNDYAEYRKDNPEETEIQKPGRCVRETGNGSLTLTTDRLQRGCEIISDTFGFAIGQDKENGYNTPIASNGRVLAYPFEDIEMFKTHIGWPVCSGPNGTVSIMTEIEEEQYPSRIIGTISEIPEYEEWGSEKVKVNGRVWIRIK